MRVLLVITLLSASLVAWASDINELMRDVGDTMLRMLPALHRDEPDRVLILENLVRLDYLFDEARPHIEAQPVGARISYDLLKERLDEAIALSDRPNLGLMRLAVNDAFELCASCHAQDGISKRAFGVSRIRELDDFLAAEFSFLTRDYSSALTSIDGYFDGESRSANRDQVALDRVLVIAAGIYADPVFAAGAFRKFTPKLIGRQRQRVNDWIMTLDRLAGDGASLQSPLGHDSVRSLDRFLSNEWPALRSALNINEQEAYWVTIRGALTRQLMANPKSKEMPRLLYWLAVTDRALHYRFFSSLSRAYLERCVREYPGHPYAKKCIDEYEFLVLVSFSGSGGTQVPLPVREHLNELRALVY